MAVRDFPELRKAVAELDGLETRRATSRAFITALLPHLMDIMEPVPEDVVLSYGQIATHLNRRDIPTSSGGKWQRVQIMRLLMIDHDQATSKRIDWIRQKIAEFERDLPGVEEHRPWRHELERVERRHRASARLVRQLALEVRRILRRSLVAEV
jgi:hypothetical protein